MNCYRDVLRCLPFGVNVAVLGDMQLFNSHGRVFRGYTDKSYDFFVYDGQGFSIKGLSGEGGLFGTIAGSTVSP